MQFLSFLLSWTLLVYSVLSRTCYDCYGGECDGNSGRVVDCGNSSGSAIWVCRLNIDVSGSKVTPGAAFHRYCNDIYWDPPEGISCVFRTQGSAVKELLCSCAEDLCNGGEPKCSEMPLYDDDIRKVYGSKCKDEIEEYDRQKKNWPAEGPSDYSSDDVGEEPRGEAAD